MEYLKIERVFTVSIRSDIDTGFVFPEKQPLKLKLKDMLEDNVDEKYYLSNEMVDKIRYSKFAQEKSRIQEKDYYDTLLARDYKDHKCVEVSRKYGIFDTEKSTHQAGSVYDENGLSPTLDTMQGGYRQPCIEIKNNTKKGYLESYDGDGINISSRMKYQRGNVQKETIQTLTTSGGNDRGVVVNGKQLERNKDKTELRIRKLTPKECWRLMGFDDEDFEKASKVNSNTQLYKQAGNSICVQVLIAILNNILNN